MNATTIQSIIWSEICAQLIDVILRPLFKNNRRAFVETLDALDCYPCRVCYNANQMWIEFGYEPEEDWDEEDFR